MILNYFYRLSHQSSRHRVRLFCLSSVPSFSTGTHKTQAPTVARLLLPDDANPSGNVHGGTILQLMDQAGMITATRHANSGNDVKEASSSRGENGVTTKWCVRCTSFKKGRLEKWLCVMLASHQKQQSMLM